MPSTDARTELLRHLVATIAFRATVALRGFPEAATATPPADGARTPVELLVHLADLMQWSALLVRGEGRPQRAVDGSWQAAEARLYAGLAALDAALVAGIAPDADVDALLQGPLADALTHVGQLLLMRRLAGAPAEGQRYMRASITAGVVGPEQPGLAGGPDVPAADGPEPDASAT